MKKPDFNINQLIESVFLFDDRDLRLMQLLSESAVCLDVDNHTYLTVSNEKIRSILDIPEENFLESLEKLAKYKLVSAAVISSKDQKQLKQEHLEFNVPLVLVQALHNYSFTLDSARVAKIIQLMPEPREFGSSYLTALAIALKYALEGQWVCFYGNQYQNVFDFGLEANPKAVLPYLTMGSKHTKDGTFNMYRPTLKAYQHLARWFAVRDLIENRTLPKRHWFFSRKENRITGVSATTAAGTFWLPKPFRHHAILHALNCDDTVEHLLNNKEPENWRHDILTSMQGFVTADGQVVDRKRAAIIASYYRQTFVPFGKVIDDLYSEDVWEGPAPETDPLIVARHLRMYPLTPELVDLIQDHDDKNCPACSVPRRQRYTLLAHNHNSNRCRYQCHEL